MNFSAPQQQQQRQISPSSQFPAQYLPGNFPERPAPSLWAFVGLCFLVFVISMAAQLVHHLLCDHSLVMFGFDGKHYLATSQAIAAALMSLFKGDVSAFAATIAGSGYSHNLVWDGPIIPGIPGLIFALIGRLPQETDWAYFAAFFSVLASYSAVLVAVATRSLTRNNKLALTAGLLFALYPTTLIATGVFRSEILAVSLMMTLLLALVGAPRSIVAAIFAGVVGGVFAMVKPVMIPAIGLLCLFAGIGGGGKRVRTLTLLALSGILTIAPWSVYTAINCGKISITAERGPSYNAGVGTDLMANGWCTMPETEHVAEAKKNPSPAAVFVQEWKAHPFELSKLTLRRVSRLWSNPWNDFREAVYGIPVEVQVAWHLVLVTIGFMGLGLYVFSTSAQRCLLGNLMSIALLSHLSFIMFQTMGRYAFTSMALLAVFAAFGLGRLNTMVRSGKPSFGVTAAAACGITAALLIFNSDSFTHAGEAHEIAHLLKPGESVGRSVAIALPTSIAADNGVLVLIDMTQDGRDASDPRSVSVHLNGQPVSTPLLPLNCFNGRNYFLFDTMAEHAAFMRASVRDFRQWRAVLVEPQAKLLKEGGVNEIEVTNNGRYPITVFGDTTRREGKIVPLPSPDYFASDRMLVSLTSMEPRIASLIPEAIISQHSYLKSQEGGSSISSLDDNLRLQLAVFDSSDATASGTDSLKACTYNLRPEQFHWFARTKDGLRLNKAVLKGVGAVSCELPLAADLSGLTGKATQVEVSLRFSAKRVGGPGRLGVSAALLSKDAKKVPGVVQQLGQFPDFVRVESLDWTQFELKETVPLARLGGIAGVRALSLSLLPCPRLESCYGGGRNCSDIEVKDLRVIVQPLALTDIAGRQLTVY